MICPECEAEYREGFTRCADCDVDLVAELEAPVLAPLTAETDPDMVSTLLQGLESVDIPYVIQAGTALPLLDGEEESLTSPRPWSARIWVAPQRATEAAELLAWVRADVKRQRESG